MKAEQKRELERYYRSISKELICGGIEKRAIIGSIKDSVECFMSDHPDADIAAVIENFGSAKEVAEEYFNNETNEVVKAKVKRSRTIVISVIVALVIALLVYIAFIVTAIISNLKTTNGYAIEYITVISESDTDDLTWLSDSNLQ